MRVTGAWKPDIHAVALPRRRCPVREVSGDTGADGHAYRGANGRAATRHRQPVPGESTRDAVWPALREGRVLAHALKVPAAAQHRLRHPRPRALFVILDTLTAACALRCGGVWHSTRARRARGLGGAASWPGRGAHARRARG